MPRKTEYGRGDRTRCEAFVESTSEEQVGKTQPEMGAWSVSGEVWVANKEDLQAVRSVRRLSVEEQWSEFTAEFVRHVPWDKSGEDPDADGELPEALQAPSATAFAATGSVDPPRVIVVNTKETAPREFCIKKKDVEAHGQTKDRSFCRTMFLGDTRQAHTLENRERFRHLMKDDEKGSEDAGEAKRVRVEDAPFRKNDQLLFGAQQVDHSQPATCACRSAIDPWGRAPQPSECACASVTRENAGVRVCFTVESQFAKQSRAHGFSCIVQHVGHGTLVSFGGSSWYTVIIVNTEDVFRSVPLSCAEYLIQSTCTSSPVDVAPGAISSVDSLINLISPLRAVRPQDWL